MGNNTQGNGTITTPEQLKIHLSMLIKRVIEAPYELSEQEQKRLISSANCAQKLYATLSGIFQWENGVMKKDKEIQALLDRLDALEASQIRRVK